MADTQQQGTSQDAQVDYSSPDFSTTQPQFDSKFDEQIGQLDSAGADQAWQEFFRLAQDNIRAAQRIQEVYTSALMKQRLVSQVSQHISRQQQQQLPQLVQQVTQQVVAAIRRDPSLLQRSGK